jgi:hypothetical protein
LESVFGWSWFYSGPPLSLPIHHAARDDAALFGLHTAITEKCRNLEDTYLSVDFDDELALLTENERLTRRAWVGFLKDVYGEASVAELLRLLDARLPDVYSPPNCEEEA